MARRKPGIVRGSYTPRRTETDYLGTLLDVVTPADWRAVVDKALTMAKAGDGGSRAWLAQYLMGRPAAPAPTPLTVVVQQLSGRDPVVDKLAEPHLKRDSFPALYSMELEKDRIRADAAEELQRLRTGHQALPMPPPGDDGLAR
jgi:hypothetical protein